MGRDKCLIFMSIINLTTEMIENLIDFLMSCSKRDCGQIDSNLFFDRMKLKKNLKLFLLSFPSPKFK